MTTTPTEQALREALRDMLSGWIYIRDTHGDLHGVGWDRAQNKAEAALALTTPPAAPARHNGSISFEEAQELARKHAKAEPESYYSEPFEPHLWVINAVIEASATWYQRAVDERIRRVKDERAAPPPAAPAPTQGAKMKITDEMVSRFLCWPLPKDFGPDCGISFKPFHPNGTTRYEPVGTNLFTAEQARAMLEHVFGAAPPQGGEMLGNFGPPTSVGGQLLFRVGAPPQAEPPGHCKRIEPCECAPEAQSGCVSWVPQAEPPNLAWRDHQAAIDSKALATATEIALMWGHDRSQFVSRIQVAVIDAMLWLKGGTVAQAEPPKPVAAWRPIETAPKDGSEFLGYRHGQIANAYRVQRDDCEMWVFGGTSAAVEHHPQIRPTHWMPLPPDPGAEPVPEPKR